MVTIYGIYEIFKRERMHISRNKLGKVAKKLAAEDGLVLCKFHKEPSEDVRKKIDIVKEGTVTIS